MKNTIQQAILNRHTHQDEVDQEQLDAVFSSHTHLVVEAPAGYGKTKTMVSKIAFLIATNEILYPKKILALTFSINAAFKIRKDVAEQLPVILNTSNSFSRNATQVVDTTNYHGLSRRILSHYGYLIDKKLCEVDTLIGVGIEADDDRKMQRNLQKLGIVLTNTERATLMQYTKSIHLASSQTTRQEAIKDLSRNLKVYLEIVKDKFLSKNYITFDAILLFTRQLFRSHPQILDFYRNYFPIIIVDEFQDTNILQWSLLQDLVGRDEEEKNSLFIFGDRYQTIYEFIGAMEDIIDVASTKYGMQEIRLKTNHRFKGNDTLLMFDANIREIAKNLHNPSIDTPANIKIKETANQDDEARQIISQINFLLEQDSSSTISILTKAGKTDFNTRKIVEYLNAQKENGFSYFFALYSDEDKEYVDFHNECLSTLHKNIPNSQNFKSLCNSIKQDMNINNSSEIWESLRTLLETFFDHIFDEFKWLHFEEKIDLVIDTLRNKALKQYLMYVKNSRVMLSTVHGSKGLEWDYVILPDMEKESFPSFPPCKKCSFTKTCQLDWTQIKPEDDFVKLFRQELNVFYVGGTRARKSVYFTSSVVGLNYKGEVRTNNQSCFLSLNGLQVED
jgi:DNA helicase-2/ATP-dependent DNA helicase PcrA